MNKKVRRMEVKHMQNEWVEIELVRLMKTTPLNAYHAWLDLIN